MGNEFVAEYIIYGVEYFVYGCWDETTPECEYDFFDVFDKEGNCLNLGEPFWEMPSRDELREYLDEFVLNQEED